MTRLCAHVACAKPLARRDSESASNFNRREHCNMSCAVHRRIDDKEGLTGRPRRLDKATDFVSVRLRHAEKRSVWAVARGDGRYGSIAEYIRALVFTDMLQRRLDAAFAEDPALTIPRAA